MRAVPCTWSWCKSTAGQMHLNDDKKKMVQMEPWNIQQVSSWDCASVDISHFLKHESVSILPRETLHLLRGPRKVTSPLRSLEEHHTWRPERASCSYHSTRLLRLAFEGFNLGSAGDKWHWENVHRPALNSRLRNKVWGSLVSGLRFSSPYRLVEQRQFNAKRKSFI